MPVFVHNKAGTIIHRSKNLRGLLEHARRATPERAILEDVNCFGANGKTFKRYELRVSFHDGSVCSSEWESWSVCADWLARRYSWPYLVVRGYQPFCEAYAKARQEREPLRKARNKC